MEIADAVGDEVLWAGAAQAYGWHAIVAGRLREGFEILERAFDVADRHRRPFLAFMGANIRGQFTWGAGAPDEAQAYFERPLRLPYVGNVAYRQQIADGIGRCHASRGELEAARRAAVRRQADLDHPLAQAAARPLGRRSGTRSTRWPRERYATSRRTGNRWDEWASQHLAARVRAPARRARARRSSCSRTRCGSSSTAARRTSSCGCGPTSRARSPSSAASRRRASTSTAAARSSAAARTGAGAPASSASPMRSCSRTRDARTTPSAPSPRRARCSRATGSAASEADLLHQWGRLLAAPERLDEAAELYRRHDAGRVWLERVDADRRRLG